MSDCYWRDLDGYRCPNRADINGGGYCRYHWGQSLKKEYAMKDWLKEVDAHLSRLVGVTSSDLPDCCYADWFEDGMSPEETARSVMMDLELGEYE